MPQIMYQFYGYLFLSSVSGAVYIWWQMSFMWRTIIAIALALIFLRLYMNGGVNTHFPDLSSQIVVITGANSGIGYSTALEIAKLNPSTLILACRNKYRGQSAVNQIQKECKVKNVKFMQLDLNDLNSVRNFARKFNQTYDKCDILVNNAGLFEPNRQETAQGFERTFGVNHLGHFLLTKLLLHKIINSKQGRVICVSSRNHKKIKRMKFRDLQLKSSYDQMTAYNQSKLANVLFAKQLAIKLKSNDIKYVKCCSVHPGDIYTNIANTFWKELNPIYKIIIYILSPILFIYYLLFFKSSWQGAQTSLHCCLVPFDQLSSGEYYSDCKVEDKTLDSHWKEDSIKLWNLSEDMVKDFVLKGALKLD